MINEEQIIKRAMQIRTESFMEKNLEESVEQAVRELKNPEDFIGFANRVDITMKDYVNALVVVIVCEGYDEVSSE